MKPNPISVDITKREYGRFVIYLIPVIILILGSYIHYQRGYFGVGVATVHARGSDDAYITYRYGWNLLHFGTLSWNESGYRQTEGFTNPLWVLGSVVWSFPGKKEWVYPLSVMTSIALCALLLFLLTYLGYKNNNRSFTSIIGLIIVAAIPAIWLHVTSGLEGGVFGIGLAVLAYMALTNKTNQYRPFYLILLTLFLGFVRSDAFIYLTIILIAAIIAGSQSWKSIAIGLIISSLTLLSWRYVTFGAWLPNTAIAKINFTFLERISGGLNFILLAILNSGLLVVLLFGLFGLILSQRRVALAGAFIIIAWLMYYLYIGGDWGIERHLVGLYFLSAVISAPLWRSAKPMIRILLFFILVSTIFISIFTFGNRFSYSSKKSKDPWVMLGQAIEADRDNYGVLVTRAAGKIPFYAGGECIDALGLNDPYLATLKQDKFVPGHSAGSNMAAIELACSHPLGVYSTLTYLGSVIINNPEDINLWVDIKNPQDEVHHQVTPDQWKETLQTEDPPIWSIISEPVRIYEKCP